MINSVFRAPSRPFVSNAWQALNADGTAPYFDDWRHDMYAQLYAQLSDLGDLRGLSDIAASRFGMMAYPFPLDPATRAMLLRDMTEQRGRSRLQTLISAQVMGVFRDLGQAPPAEAVDDFVLNQSGTVAFCKSNGLPLGDWRAALAAVEAQRAS